jgi:paraquat-inducible protein B
MEPLGPAPARPVHDEPLIIEEEGFSKVWIVPLVALLIGLWLGWQQYINRPVPVRVTFASGEGIVIGKTEVRYQGISVGTVKDMSVAADGKGVEALIEMDHRVGDSLLEGTQFWLVKPEVSFAGISGLDTLITGNYIGMKVGEGKPSRHFVARNTTPPVDASTPGLHLVLEARDLGSLHVGSPVLYRKIAVGMVSEYLLRPDGKSVELKVYIRPDYAHLVKKHSRFWNSSGVALEGNLSGIEFRMDSLASLVAGGISFDTPPRKDGEPAVGGDRFSLFPDYNAARSGLLATIRFPDARGIDKVTTQVRYKGFKIGDIQSVAYEKSSDAALVKVAFDPRYEQFLTEGTRFWLVKPELSLSQISGLDTLITGTFIEVSPGEGAAKNYFDALPQPPKIDTSRLGLRVKVLARELPALSKGAPVLYRKVPVGEVESFELAADGKGIVMHLFIQREYSRLLTSASRFWNLSGLSLTGGLNGISLQMGSAHSVLVGGLGFFTPEDARDAKPARDGQQFSLYDSLEQAREQGVEITISFADGTGLENGAPIRFQGIAVGQVKRIGLSADLKRVIVTARLDDSAERLARAQSRFWLVKPEIGLTGASNLDTLIKGVYIAVEPGTGPAKNHFEGSMSSPPRRVGSGLDLTLWARQRGSIEPGSKVLYRQVAVGEVRSIRLSDSADSVLFMVTIEPRYASLVRQNSVFWNASGVQVDVSLFKGASFRTESLESVLKGGIAFATPDVPAAPALAGASFRLNAQPQSEWLDWKPRIVLPPAP